MRVIGGAFYSSSLKVEVRGECWFLLQLKISNPQSGMWVRVSRQACIRYSIIGHADGATFISRLKKNRNIQFQPASFTLILAVEKGKKKSQSDTSHNRLDP